MTGTGSIVRPATPADYPAIAALLDRAFGKIPFVLRLMLWKWRYDSNPARTDAFPPFFVAEQGRRIVGAHGLIPLRLKAGDARLDASCSCDLVVDPAARSAGMKLKLKVLGKDVSPFHLSTSANEAANRITLALGGREVASGRRRYLKPLKISGLLRRYPPRGGKPARMASQASLAILKPIDWMLAAGRAVAPRGRVRGAGIKEVARFDDRYERFWERWAQEKEILVVKDSSYLNWRYSSYPFPGVQSFELSAGRDLMGFAVLHTGEDEDRLRFAALLEFAFTGNERSVRDHLLGEAIRRAARAGAHYVTAMASSSAGEELLLRRGFRARDKRYSPVTYKNNSGVSDNLFAQDRNWHLSLGDGDSCYYVETESRDEAAG